MIPRLARLALAAACLVIVVTSLVPIAAGDLLLTIAAVLVPMALIALGAAREGRLGPVGPPLAALVGLLAAVFAGMFAFRGRVVDGPWWGGLPAAAAFQVYGLFVLPLLLTSIAYARTFRTWTLPDDDIEALRRRFPRAEGDPGDGGEDESPEPSP